MTLVSGVRRVIVALVVCLLLAVTACTNSSSPESSAGPESSRPNIVFVLTDDLATNLVQYLPHVQAMEKAGMSFSNYSVTDSLCCPSRSSIFTGQFPHNTGVFTNSPPDGGYTAFQNGDDAARTYATALHDQGYRTGLMGKYLNGFPVPGPGKPDPGTLPVPPGWDEWDVAGNGYPEFAYTLDENGHRTTHGKKPEDYLTDVVSGKAADFVKSAAQDGKPFVLETATFAPHGPYTPAPRDRDKFPGLRAPREPTFNQVPTDAPPWLAQQAANPLTPDQIGKIDQAFRKRAQAVQAVDAMIGRLQDTLRATGQDRNTYFVFSSDNGYHLGDYRLNPGKQTAFDTDVHVPLVITGPGVPAGRTTPAVASNIDLAPTFEQLSGAAPLPTVDGRSLVPLLQGQTPPGQPAAALVEHHGPDTDPKDPDKPRANSGNPPSYEALRTAQSTYVEYADGSHEFYDRAKDPDELHNVYNGLSQEIKDKLHRQAVAMKQCKGTAACTQAAQAG
ncbi:sulfatase-like hydrolase/transferase [Amycolatopsis sp. NPDC051903]|uniref:sulfatase-like hydrolase/transferase n=1 Tax=Amycolatopsis sp. NPDC051903 TaxID=3363936 RepID=UPI0037A9EE95